MQNKKVYFILMFLILFSYNLNSISLEKRILQRADNSSLIYYLDTSCTTGQFSLLALFQGSETLSPSSNLSNFFDREQLSELNAGLLLIEKPGVDENNLNTAEYLRSNTILQRIEDFKLVISDIKQTESNWNNELFVSGISEGGMVAALLAPVIPEAKGCIIFCGGCGMSLKEELILSAYKKYLQHPFGWFLKHIEATYIYIMLYLTKLFPTSSRTCLGETNSFKWWQQIADLQPSSSLLGTNIPIYLAHGSADINCPIESADKLAILFEQTGNRNLTYQKYNNYDHSFSDELGKNHWDEVIQSTVDWIKLIQKTSK